MSIDKRLRIARTLRFMGCPDGLCGLHAVGKCSPRRGWPIEYGGARDPDERVKARKRLLDATHAGTFTNTPLYWTREHWFSLSEERKAELARKRHTRSRRKWVRETWVGCVFDVRKRRTIFRLCTLPAGHQGGHQWGPRQAWRCPGSGYDDYGWTE